uniref:Uncharacterized protein n=1 Tax=Oryza punctata TaxID=4537 RepID=A0A0E0LCB4_ORYPU
MAGPGSSRSRSGASSVGVGCGWAPGGEGDVEVAQRSLGGLCGRQVAPLVWLHRSMEFGHCAGDSEVKALLCLLVLATATPSNVVHLLEGVAIGAPVQLHFKEILRVKTLNSFGSDDVTVLSA